MTLPEKIRVARTEAGLTQAEFAGKVGASLRAVGTWENGDRTPGFHFLAKIAWATNRPLAWFADEAAV